MRNVLLVVILASSFGPLALSRSSAPPRSAIGAATDVLLQGVDDATDEDAALIAKSRGWTIDEARAHLHAAAVVEEIAVRVSIDRPDAFVGSQLAEEPRGAPTLLVKGPADSYIKDLVRQAGIDIMLADDQPFSLAELVERKDRVRTALIAMGYESIAVGVNIAGRGVIRAGAAIAPGAPVTGAVALARLPEDLRGAVDLKLVASNRGYSELTAFGGMRLDSTVDDDAWCTSGWTVQRISDGLFGISTAAHCLNAINRINHPGHGLHSVTFKAQHFGNFGDVEWYTTAAGVQDDFYSSASVIRDVVGVEPHAGISLGEAICFYGRTSNTRDCSLQVMDTWIDCTGSLGVLNRMVLMDGQGVSNHGDSGGGFSVNNTAYGLIHGGCDPAWSWEEDGTGWLSFSVADLMDEALGVRVWAA